MRAQLSGQAAGSNWAVPSLQIGLAVFSKHRTPRLKLVAQRTAISNVYYRVETNADAGSNNWGELSGDVTTTSNTAAKLDLFPPGSRFYRVHVLP